MFNLYRTQNAWQMLHTEGNKVLNEKGEKVRLLGVNCAPLVWLSYSEKIMDMITYACDEWKANTIRLPLAQDRWFGFAKAQKGVDESGRTTMTVIFQPDSEGHVTISDNTTLEPMTLIALFQDAAEATPAETEEGAE